MWPILARGQKGTGSNKKLQEVGELSSYRSAWGSRQCFADAAVDLQNYLWESPTSTQDGRVSFLFFTDVRAGRAFSRPGLSTCYLPASQHFPCKLPN